MRPILIHIGPLPLPSYGFMLASSFAVGILLASRRARARGIAPGLVLDTSVVIVPAAIAGARVLYVLSHREEVRGWAGALSLWDGGLSMYGGVLAAMGASWAYLRWRRAAFLDMADVMAPSLALGLGLTRIGCFLNGCCFGRPTIGPLGVRFPAESFAGRVFPDTLLHPTQLYSSLTGFVMLALLLAFDRRPRPAGQLFGLYLVLDATGRFVLDFFRYYEADAYLPGGWTASQVICGALFGFGILLSVRARAGLFGTPGTRDPAS